MSHFSEHLAQDKQISFLHFLAMHYSNGQKKDSDYEKDMKLPFKTTTDNSFTVFYFNSPPSFSFHKITYISQPKLRVYYKGDAYSFAYLNAIWQPPRIC